MNTMIDTTKVTAVRLADGWREGVTDFIFFGDDQHVDSITRAGASWSEPGCRFTCPLSAVRAVREGTPPPEEPKPDGRPNDKLQAAMIWLTNALEDGLLHPVKVLRDEAKHNCITVHTLDRAWMQIGAKSKKFKGVWCWYVAPTLESELEQAAEAFTVTAAQTGFVQSTGSSRRDHALAAPQWIYSGDVATRWRGPEFCLSERHRTQVHQRLS
jgi:hypothetical protein